MPDQQLTAILAGFNDEYLPGTVCLKLIDQAFLAFVTSESFVDNTKREEMTRQVLIFQERLSELFVYLSEKDLSLE